MKHQEERDNAFRKSTKIDFILIFLLVFVLPFFQFFKDIPFFNNLILFKAVFFALIYLLLRDSFGSASIGKRICGEIVIDNETGKPIGFMRGIARNSFFPIIITFVLAYSYLLFHLFPSLSGPFGLLAYILPLIVVNGIFGYLSEHITSFDKLTDKLVDITLGINTTIVNKREFQYRNKKNREYSRSNSDNNQHEKNSTDKAQHKKDENNYNYKKSYTNDNKRKEQKTKGNRSQSNYKNKPASKIYDSKSPYEILGVSRNSTDDEIDKRYKILRSQFHSDKFPNMSEKFLKELDEKFKEVKQAYNTLASRRR